MAVDPVTQTNVTAVASLTDVKPVNQEVTKSKPKPSTTDTVTISAAAQALQEATETSAQTAKEARSGDIQAQHLLAREAAAEEAKESPSAKSQESVGNLR